MAEKTIIGIAGEKGSFSEEAAEHYARKQKLKEYDLRYLVSVENVLSALEKGEIEKGIFPIENSNGGVVFEAVYAMAAHLFAIEKFFEIDVRHCLLVKNGAVPSEVSAITSHDQALRQCRTYLHRKWGDVELLEYSDTALAAKDLHEGKLPKTTAVIAPARCAELYGLEVLEEGIQDLKFNYTTFIAAADRG